MNQKNFDVEIRCDDVLQRWLWTDQSAKHLKKATPFELFLEADKVFEKYQYPCTLAVITDGILIHKEWVEHIKKNIHRYNIELHGSSHYYYIDLSEKEGELELRHAKEKLENTFGQEITTWYVPFSRKKAPEWAERVCKKLGLKYPVVRTKIDSYIWIEKYKRLGHSPFSHVNFHYWHPGQREQTNELVKILCENS